MLFLLEVNHENRLNFAEVTLILDNADERMLIPYTEISVTRRVYRSGESEYLLNNQQCRLKDITDLFMDSGLRKRSFFDYFSRPCR